MDNEQFVQMFTAGFQHVLEAVSENGRIHLDHFSNLDNSELIETMSNNLAEIYFSYTRGERDVFLPKLPELMCFMIVNALQAALPKHQRVFNSVKFRELLLDWATELVGGIRSMNTRTGREWFFQDAVDMPVMTSGTSSAFQDSMSAALTARKTVLPLNSVGCRYHLDHSPLVARYIDKNNPSLAAATAKNMLHVTMTHDPDRPLLSLQHGLEKTVKFREKKVDSELVGGLRKEAIGKGSRLLKEYKASKQSVQEDIGKLRVGMRAAIAMLQGKAISKAALINQLSVITNTTAAASAAAAATGLVA